MRIDAHQHYWKFNTTEYSWISDQMKVLKRDYLPDDLLPELHGIGFDGSIAVQARQNPVETRWLLENAEKYGFVKGVVGWIDLCSDECENQLNEFVKNRKFVGVRHVLQDEPDDRFMLTDSFLRGISILGKHNIVYELLILPKHLPFAEELVRLFPGQQFVLDHIAKPLIKEGTLSPWEEGIQKLAKHPNISCKLSGMVTEAGWSSWKAEDFLPYLSVALDAFGPSRLMIGSDWPVCTVSSSYGKTMNLVIDYLSSLNDQDRDLILGLNAMRLYKLQTLQEK
jgi:L-fuconolactonase